MTFEGLLGSSPDGGAGWATHGTWRSSS
jgi:hypothetical protein